MLFNVNIYNTIDDFRKAYGDIVTFEAVPCTEVAGIVKFAIDHGKAVSVVPFEPDGDSEEPKCDSEKPKCDYCDI